MKVAIIIPTMNRPDFMLRQFAFYEFMNNQHPVYVVDSSGPENSEKLKSGINRFKKLHITYHWAPPKKDYVYQILPLIKEKYCIQSCDDDLVIPDTISECADFLEANPDYGTCMGKQVNIRFRQEDYDKPYGLIAKQTIPMGQSIEDGNMLKRVKDFWSNQYFVCFAVTRTETEKAIREITKHFDLAEDMFEFLLFDILLVSGKAKVIDKLGYIMQRSSLPFFDHSLTEDFLLHPAIGEKWKICEEGFSKILQEKGISEKEGSWAVRGMFIVYLAQQYSIEKNWLAIGQTKFDSLTKVKTVQSKRSLSKELKHLASNLPFLKTIYYKLNPPNYVTSPESKYYHDFKIVKDFLERKSS